MFKHIRDTLLEKFMRHVQVSHSINQSQCWWWIGSTDGQGYGQLASDIQGATPLKGHRVAWTLAYGEIPPEMFVCHRCDNPRCVRPSHLFLGTQKDNMNDCSKKDRVRRKLTPDEAYAIRYMPGAYRDIARQFNISKSGVAAIKSGKSWKNLHSPEQETRAVRDFILL